MNWVFHPNNVPRWYNDGQHAWGWNFRPQQVQAQPQPQPQPHVQWAAPPAQQQPVYAWPPPRNLGIAQRGDMNMGDPHGVMNLGVAQRADMNMAHAHGQTVRPDRPARGGEE